MDFDEGANEIRAKKLFVDALFSLVRQWIFGCGPWKIVAAVLVATAEMYVVMGAVSTIDERVQNDVAGQ